MQGAEANFLRTFDRKMKDLQFLLELVRKNNIGKQTTMKASPNEMVSKVGNKLTQSWFNCIFPQVADEKLSFR